MRLIEDIARIAESADSPFQAQLAREDVARLEKLCALTAESADQSDFRKRGLHAGWTPGDLRTHLLADALHPLMDLVFAVGQYNLVSMALNTLGVQLDEGVPGFPER